MVGIGQQLSGCVGAWGQARGITVLRNAFGRQAGSCTTDVSIPVIEDNRFLAVLIRGLVMEAVGPAVESVARPADGAPVAARERCLLTATFHPERTLDKRLHPWFLDEDPRAALRPPAGAKVFRTRHFAPALWHEGTRQHGLA